MNTWLTVDLYTLFLILLLIFCAAQKKSNPNLKTKIFKEMMLTLMILVIIDSIWHIDNINIVIKKIATSLTISLNPLFPIFSLFYVDTWMDENSADKRNRTYIYVMAIIASIISINTITSTVLDTRLIYYYVKDVYCRGPFYFYFALYIVLSMCSVGFYAIYYKNHIPKQYQNALITFPFVSAFIGLWQIYTMEVPCEYIGMFISILLLFIVVQNRDMNMDGLTGLCNRRKFDIELLDKIKNATMEKTFAYIMIDLDFFKEINDTYGHQVGDEALKITAEILKYCFGSNDVIARYGGDEFVVLSLVQKQEELDEKIKYLHNKIYKFSRKNDVPYTLSASIGGAIYDPSSKMTDKEFMSFVDKLMYKEKEEKHKMSEKCS